MDRFLNWYKARMFSHVAQNKAASDSNQLSNLLCDQLAASFGKSRSDVHAIKAKFDKYDADKSGSIDFLEFEIMMKELLSVQDGKDLPEKRLTRLWEEADADSSGAIDFSEFVEFYIKYFSAEAKSTMVQEAFYVSFNPELQRRKSLQFMEAQQWNGTDLA
mmetsp:Transcript_13447/g.23740  ORF Transcript_13447/g.23740 Transcript_13447/m.23740 type:complete len:161 (-) Transcript_13447:100-582(-)